MPLSFSSSFLPLFLLLSIILCCALGRFFPHFSLLHFVASSSPLCFVSLLIPSAACPVSACGCYRFHWWLFGHFDHFGCSGPSISVSGSTFIVVFVSVVVRLPLFGVSVIICLLVPSVSFRSVPAGFPVVSATPGILRPLSGRFRPSPSPFLSVSLRPRIPALSAGSGSSGRHFLGDYSAAASSALSSSGHRNAFWPLVLCPSGRFGHCSAADLSPCPALFGLFFGLL